MTPDEFRKQYDLLTTTPEHIEVEVDIEPIAACFINGIIFAAFRSLSTNHVFGVQEWRKGKYRVTDYGKAINGAMPPAHSFLPKMT